MNITNISDIDLATLIASEYQSLIRTQANLLQLNKELDKRKHKEPVVPEAK
jgi:hypothetical protein